MGIDANVTAAFYTSSVNSSTIGLGLLTIGFEYIEPSGLFSLDTILNYTTFCVVNLEV